MKKTAIIVHPGWCGLSDNNAKEFYNEIIERYDSCHIFLPILDNKLKKVLVLSCIDKIVDFICYKKRDIYLDNIFTLRSPLAKKFIATLRLGIKKRYKYKLLKNKNNKNLGRFYLTKLSKHKFVKKLLISKLDYYLYELNFLKFIFVGDFSHIPPIKEVADSFLLYKNTKITNYMFGGFYFTKLYLDNMLRTGELKLDGEIDVFGEYYNQCVRGISDVLKNHKITHTMKPEYSIFTKQGISIPGIPLEKYRLVY